MPRFERLQRKPRGPKVVRVFGSGSVTTMTEKEYKEKFPAPKESKEDNK